MVNPESICVVGGLGRMGSLMARLFHEAGYWVEIADRSAGAITWESVARHDVVLVAVPVGELEDVLSKIGPGTREDGVVIDITSLKEAPVRWMLEHCRGEPCRRDPALRGASFA